MALTREVMPTATILLLRQSSKYGIGFMPIVREPGHGASYNRILIHYANPYFYTAASKPSISPHFSHLGHDASVISGVWPGQSLLIRRVASISPFAIPLRQSCTQFYLSFFRFWAYIYSSPCSNSEELFAALGRYPGPFSYTMK